MQFCACTVIARQLEEGVAEGIEAEEPQEDAGNQSVFEHIVIPD